MSKYEQLLYEIKKVFPSASNIELSLSLDDKDKLEFRESILELVVPDGFMINSKRTDDNGNLQVNLTDVTFPFLGRIKIK